ncbi:SDR family oxidoreductase [Herbaspirillum sp. SJZ107]|uniref:SDR family oxidoreductase n=1 Tax=Herbaspirillum sp. SJZ107 TaxID=2572881 RepID=UPI00114F3369|nr:SDR family oxidoreductase [Herbaspirillum sp. SJZ107]TQK07620.1 short-subunit dehydrogenase [Herbaspirillum sp. SJZ107]
MEAHHKEVALVTGANKGIGLEIARQLGHAGIAIIVGARDGTRGEAAAATLRGEGVDARFIQLDVTDQASIEQAAAAIGATHGRLDILVNNAGIGDPADGPPAGASVDAARRLFATNFFGALSVTQAMLPLLRQAPAGRIVNMSSSLGSMTVNGDATSPYHGVHLIGYNASKAALNMLTVQLAETLRGTNIAVNAACPGYVATDLNGHGGPLTPAEGAATPVRLALLRGGQPNGKFLSAEGQVPW